MIARAKLRFVSYNQLGSRSLDLIGILVLQQSNPQSPLIISLITRKTSLYFWGTKRMVRDFRMRWKRLSVVLLISTGELGTEYANHWDHKRNCCTWHLIVPEYDEDFAWDWYKYLKFLDNNTIETFNTWWYEC